MQYTSLSDGAHTLKVSRVCLGTWQFGDTTGTFNNAEEMAEETENAVVAAALDAGINFFDTAEGYGSGKSERALGRALRATGRPRNDYVIASKVLPSNLAPADVRAAAERSIEALGTHIDLYQIHWPNWDVPIEATLKALEELKREGKIKMIGVSNFGTRDLGDAMAHKIPIVTNQLPYSLLMRQIETAGIVESCQQHNCGILCYSPLSQGLLTGKYARPEDCPDGLSRSRFFKPGRSPLCRHQDEGCEEELFQAIAKIKEIAAEVKGATMATVSLAWALAQPGVTAVVVGASKPEQITRNTQAASLKLSGDVLERLSEASEPVKRKLGDNPDMWGDKCRYR